MTSKPAAREQGKAARTALGDTTRTSYNHKIVDACQEALDWPYYRRIMVFLPIAQQREASLWPLVRWIRKTHPTVEVYAPRVANEGLEAVKIAPESSFNESAWGIPEPAYGAVLESSEMLDMVFIPLLGFDGAGNRVGYGRGFYDRFLTDRPKTLKVGVGYECLRVADGIEANAHDVPLDAIVTERGFQRLG